MEVVYQEALAIELSSRGIPFAREVELPVYYKGEMLNCSYRADFVCFDAVIAELIAVNNPTGVEEAQLLNCLKATVLERGLLLNFCRHSLDYKHLVFSHL